MNFIISLQVVEGHILDRENFAGSFFLVLGLDLFGGGRGGDASSYLA